MLGLRGADHRAMLSPQLSEAVVLAARHGGVSPAEFVQGAVRQALADLTLRGGGYGTLSDLFLVFAQATGWLDLQGRLRKRGFSLRKRDGTVHLHSWPQDHSLLPLSALGQSETALTLRFRAPFPAPLAASNRNRSWNVCPSDKEPGGALHRPALPATGEITPPTAYRSTIPAGQLIS